MSWLARVFRRRPLRLVTSERTPENLAVMAKGLVLSRLSVAEWNALDAEDRLAIVRAADELMTARAVMLRLALASSRGAAQVLSAHDDGLAIRTLEALERVQALGDRLDAAAKGA